MGHRSFGAWIAVIVVVSGLSVATARAGVALAAPVTVKLGVVLPLSGSVAAAGRSAANGAQLAVDQANSSHLVPGVTFSLVRKSDVGPAGIPSGPTGATQLTGLIGDARVAGIIAPFDTTTALSELPATNNAGVATVSPSATDTCLTITAAFGCTGTAAELATVQPTGRTTFFRVAPADFLGQQAVADFMSKARGLHTAFLIDDTSPRGVGQAGVFTNEWKLLGGTVVGQASVAISGNVTNLLASIAAVHPDFIVFASNNVQMGISLRQQMSTAPGLTQTPLVVSSSLVSSGFAAGVGTAGGAVWAPATEPTLPELPSASAFAAQYQAKFGAPSTDSARGYDAAEALLTAIKTAVSGGATPPAIATSNAGAFRKAVVSKLALTAFAGAQGQIAFSPDGDVQTGSVGIATLSSANGVASWSPAGVEPVTGPATSAILSSNFVDFGSVPFDGGSLQMSVRLANTGVVPFRASSVTLSGTGFSIAGTNCTRNIAAASSCTITIRFTPTARIAYVAQLTIVDPVSSSPQIAKVVGIGVAPAPIAFTNTALPQAGVGVPYVSSVSAQGGIPPYHWALKLGSLPPGLSLNPTTGTVSGTATAPGRHQATVMVTDSATTSPQTTTGLISITVAPPLPAAVFVVNAGNSSVRAFALTADGNASPIITIAGPSTQLAGTTAVALTSVGALYVANANSAAITEYASGASGDTTPIAVISGPNTGLAAPQALALDRNADLYVANRPAGTVTVYAPGANGDPSPIRTITGLVGPSGLAIDAAGNLWVASSQANTISRYAAGANGAATPSATIAGPTTQLNSPQGLTVNSAGRVTAANEFGESITVYDPAPSGDVAPASRIGGADTVLSFPVGVDLDAAGNLYVSNAFTNAITVYAAGAQGDTPPFHVIIGSATGLAAPGRLIVTPPLTMLTHRLPTARTRGRYRARIWAALGEPPYHWTITHGTLPRGFTLDHRSGVISGTAPHATTTRFRVTVKDTARPSLVATRSFALTVKAKQRNPHRRRRR